MTHASAAPRAEADRCPGVLRPHRAADGALLRLRLPGGRLRAEALDIVSAASGRYADGDVQLTSRGNLQLRGVATDLGGAVRAALVDEVVRAGLLPHPLHERVRNIVCSPLTGLLGGAADLRPLIRELDEKLCSAADLADLPGPFLFVLDDGRGDVAPLAADLGVEAMDIGNVRIRVAGLACGPVLPLDRAAKVIIGLARGFLRIAQHGVVGEGPEQRPIWHVRELPRAGLELLSETFGRSSAVAPVTRIAGPHRYGPLTQDDGQAAVSTLVPLGLLARDQVEALVRAAELGSGGMIVTPWRGVVVPELATHQARRVADHLAAAGLELGDDSPWRGITTCTGAPRCAHGQGETRPLAAVIARARPGQVGERGAELVPVHVVGCARRCGSPAGEHVEVLIGRRTVEVQAGATARSLAFADAPSAVAASIRSLGATMPATGSGSRR